MGRWSSTIAGPIPVSPPVGGVSSLDKCEFSGSYSAKFTYTESGKCYPAGLGGLGLPVSQRGRWRLRGSVIERYDCVSPQDANPPCGTFKVSKVSSTSLTAYATSVKRTLTWTRVGAAGRR